MSSEIISVTKGNATSPAKEDQHSSDICAIQPWDLLDPQKVFGLKVTVDLAGGDYHTKEYLASEKGHKYVRQINPTLASVKPLLAKMKEPSVLLLRGCDFLLLSGRFSFEKFRSITALEISGCRHLTTLPENTLSQMTHLQSLDFSYLQIDRLPGDLFINAANNLRSLVLRGCSNLHVLPEPPSPLDMLEYLDLSHLPIETLPDGFFTERLRSLILRGCSKLQRLPYYVQHSRIHFLDLSYCTSLSSLKIKEVFTIKVLDLSYTVFSWQHVPRSVTHMFFKTAKLRLPRNFYLFMPNIKVCDLSENKSLGDVNLLGTCRGLEALNLSKTRIESIDFISQLTYLRTLVLRDCTRLKEFPIIEGLNNLQVLDLSGCEILWYVHESLSNQRRLKELNLCGCKALTHLSKGLFDQMSSLEKLDLSSTDIKNLPSFDDLINRGTVITHSHDSVLESSTVQTKFSSLIDLGKDNVDNLREFHLVSTFISNSGFDKFKYKFTELSQYVLFLEEKFISGVDDSEASGVKRQFQNMRDDMEYILGKVDLLESSQSCRSSEELLHELMSYDYDNHDDDPSSILKKLLRMVTKLKLLVPPKPPSVEEGRNELKSSSTLQKILIMRIKEKLANDYESLTDIQRNCLLYFACLTVPISGDKMMKESILIHLWYGEGFFDPLLYPNSTSNVIPELLCGGLHRNDANQQVSTRNPSSTIGEIGQDILQVLKRNDFVWFQEEEKKWYIGEPNLSFVITKAMEAHSFDFNKLGKLTPHFGVSKRACVLKSEIDHLPSTQVWLNYTKSPKHLESFKTVRTLLYIDELVVDISAECFSSMTDLHVLHLANLYSEQQISIVNLKFLEELKSMKQLRLLNLESFAVIQKLPDSICQLTNLRILNLAYCSNLMELPAGIASLTNLTILDLTQCHLLPQLPKGLASLSKLEVLKGFPITYKASGRQSRKACTLRGLLKLKSLRKLNLVVNQDIFPDTMDLQVLRSMKELRNLKITWYPAIHKEDELGDAVEKRGGG